MPRRICAIDVGTNTVNTLVADVSEDADSSLCILADEERFARLGQDVDANGRFAEEAIERVMVALRASVETAARFNAAAIVVGGTSSSRDADNVDVLRTRVREELGLYYEVLSGEEEARWSAVGALTTLPDLSEAVVIDIGGGSTEVARIEKGEAISFRKSLDVGTVRLSERCFSSIPPSSREVDAARDMVNTHLVPISPRFAEGLSVVSTGSTARVVAVLCGVEMQTRLFVSNVNRLTNRLLSMTPEEALALSPQDVRGREDLVAAASLILSTVLDHLRVDSLIPSVGGLRHGLALRSLVGKPT